MGFWRNVGESLGLVEKVNRNSPGAVSRDVALPPTPPANNGTASGFGQASCDAQAYPHGSAGHYGRFSVQIYYLL